MCGRTLDPRVSVSHHRSRDLDPPMDPPRDERPTNTRYKVVEFTGLVHVHMIPIKAKRRPRHGNRRRPERAAQGGLARRTQSGLCGDLAPPCFGSTRERRISRHRRLSAHPSRGRSRSTCSSSTLRWSRTLTTSFRRRARSSSANARTTCKSCWTRMVISSSSSAGRARTSRRCASCINVCSRSSPPTILCCCCSLCQKNAPVAADANACGL